MKEPNAMNDLALQFLSKLLVASAFLAATAAFFDLVFKTIRLPTWIHTTGWTSVLLQGVLLFQFPFAIPVDRIRSERQGVNDAVDPAGPSVVMTEIEANVTSYPSVARKPISHSAQALGVSGTTTWDWFSNNWPILVSAVWGTGVLILIGRRCVDYSRFVRLANCELCEKEDWNDEWKELLSSCKVSSDIPLMLSKNLGPALCRLPEGFRLVVPIDVWQRLSSSDRKSVLRHELAHFLRGDLIKFIAADFLAVLHWFNPMARHAVNRFEDALEWACDDYVSSHGRAHAANFAKVLVTIAETSQQANAWTSAIHGGRLKKRIQRLLAWESPPRSRFASALVIGLLFLCLSLHVFRIELVAQDSVGDASNSKVATSADVRDLFGKVKRAQEAIRNLSVKDVGEITRSRMQEEVAESVKRINAEPILRDSTTYIEYWTIDSSGRGWNRSEGESVLVSTNGETLNRPFHREHAFDGKNQTSLTRKEKLDGTFETVGAINTNGLTRTGLSPFECTVHLLAGVMNSIPNSVDFIWSVDRRTENGVACDVLTVEAGSGKQEFSLDSKRGYALISSRWYVRNDELADGKPRATDTGDDPTWVLYRTLATYDHQKVGDNVWLPNSAKTALINAKGEISEQTSHTFADWSLNDDIPDSRFRIDFPGGVKVHGMRKYLKAKRPASKNFFVTAVTTDFEKRTLGVDNIVAYSSIDGMSFIDLNTGEISTDQFDFRSFRNALGNVRKECGAGVLYLSIDFGVADTVGSETGTFVKSALFDMAKRSGFEDVKYSECHSNADSHVWRNLPAARGDAQEKLGNEDVLVFPLQTALDRYLGSADVYIELANEFPQDADRLLTPAAQRILQNAVQSISLPDTATACIRLNMTDEGKTADAVYDLPSLQKDSQFLNSAADFVKNLGFHNVKIHVQVGFRLFEWEYE